ncbi:hypothetical protein GETHLI_09680 [Geothrix limicola]|uniref:DUF3054 domain-containing protein n=1 Tax=Geothrix limicola TaxID=2927978 RepID=A0ABQ5QDC0_9BACT|nr:hypothetical protein [Geothrix limicola]GLH72466.1 hypothetical protein GETHLI_09680 [Geothrix limicola]
MSEPAPASTVPQPPSTLVLRLLSALTVCLSLGDLVWFAVTFPSYFRWFSQGWTSPAIPLFLLWAFLGLPSLACALITVRLARAAGRLGRATKLAFHLVLLVCTLVPLLSSFAAWTAGAGRFPWWIWMSTLAVASVVWYIALRFRARP